ncbi:hypothetical protein HUS70_14345 [Pandoraea nosoerga]|uniref:DUF4136 domain-containing protein n=1 Tax=Pandoraea nosoerga TaxID=2508296 RepID=A0A5E4U1Z0_9BURK|nr:hypothetical protein [Pandoraea nosoerga]MBN4666625.1 hypothetical protein [Pandoraea nosoerga]MBN4676790.1 hypothetical protein [Pandoraea nosoerga]MBN4682602.1 hypothetical protein [Pandoraea nosoerga]MBN4745800.1 hypothetical protein [Pandoraea nosoerga]VVD92934.1 hypothetical protein PNO31109_01704 [Pandoraea nosoerga]
MRSPRTLWFSPATRRVSASLPAIPTFRAAVLAALACAALLSACASKGVPPNPPLTEDTLDEYALVIVGLDTPLQSTWGPWTFSDESQTVNGILANKVIRTLNTNPPTRGFIAMRVSPLMRNERFGPIEFTPADNSYRFNYCKGRKVPTVQVRRGDVIYAGTLGLDSHDGQIWLRTAFDMAGARRFVQANYPSLADKLQPQPFAYYEVRSQPVCR